MKAKQIFIPLITTSIFTLTACKKDTITEPAPTPNATLSADSNYLSKRILIDKYGSSIDSTITTFNYDNSKRISTVIESYRSNGVTLLDRDSIIYFYNGSDTLPIKRYEYAETFGNYSTKDTVFSFLIYNNLNQLIKDSSISFSKTTSPSNYSIRKTIANYSYGTNKIYGFTASTIIYDLSNSYQPYTQRDTVTLDGNKNIIESRQKSLVGNTFPSLENKIYTFTYDNKPSPYLNQNINNIFPNIPDGSTDYIYNQDGSKNNRLKSREVSITSGGTGIYDGDFTGKYTYKLNGYPSSIFIPDLSVPTNYSKFVFIYKTL
jgi:hypothetical protein